jgi:hypothetical protein
MRRPPRGKFRSSLHGAQFVQQAKPACRIGNLGLPRAGQSGQNRKCHQDGIDTVLPRILLVHSHVR